jgi:hypothetical protein
MYEYGGDDLSNATNKFGVMVRARGNTMCCFGSVLLRSRSQARTNRRLVVVVSAWNPMIQH